MVEHLMSDDELVAKAIEKLRALEARRTEAPERLKALTVDRLPNRSVRDAAVIYFKSDDAVGHIKVVMDREAGDMISATYTPAKEPLA
jgi:hypothetical protein